METKERINLSDVHCFGINGQNADFMIDLVKQAIGSGRLIVFLFHGVGGGHNINVTLEDHRRLIQFLKEHEKEIWVAPMVDVASYLRSNGHTVYR
jgi:sialate O-acetylesterase